MTLPIADVRPLENIAWISGANFGGDVLGESLRAALATDYLLTVAEFVSERRFAELAGVSVAEVRRLRAAGDLIPAIQHGRRGFHPSDNLAFLMQSAVFRTHLHAHVFKTSSPEAVTTATIHLDATGGAR